MSGKRRDSKGRVLKVGEVQRADGKYMYRYVDASGERKTLYSWKLTETDKVPDGKKCTEALRTMEQRAMRDVEDGIKPNDKLTVNMLFDEFMELRSDLRQSTRTDYKCMYNTHIRIGFGEKKINSVKHSDVFRLYMSLITEKRLKFSSVQKINAILFQSFDFAVKDRVLRDNPITDVMADVSRATKEESEKRHAITVDQQIALLDFVYGDSHYSKYGPLITVLLGTGMRIGEALGLCWDNVDFDKGVINVIYSLNYKMGEDGKCRYTVSPPKTRAGIRTIPMFSDVHSALKDMYENRDVKSGAFEINGHSGFVFLNGNGKPYEPGFIHRVFQNIVADYNKEEQGRAIEEKREPAYLPCISPHILRHTFCTRLCENESNLKVIQEVMGHKTFRTTMDVYSEATELAKKQSFEQIEGRIRLR